MKRIFNILGAVLVGAACLTSCDDPEIVDTFATELSADATELTFAGLNAEVKTVNVTANGEWIATANEWITITPNKGNGNAAVTVAVTDNKDTDGTLAGSRDGRITLLGTDVEVKIAVSQDGDKAKNKKRTYNKVTKITDGKAYLIVAKDDKGVLQAASPVPETAKYAYLSPTAVEDVDGSITTADGTCGFVFTKVDGGYTITQSDGRMLYQPGTYNNFNVDVAPDAGHVWTVEFQSDGMVKIANVLQSKYMQYTFGQYKNYGSYASTQDNSSMPTLYEDTKAAEVMESLSAKKASVEVFADATSATLSVLSNVDWTVSCADAWITDYTKSGSKDGDITVSFAAYTDETTDRTATFTVKGVEKEATITLTQKKFGAVEITDISVAGFLAATVGDTLYRLTGYVTDIQKADYGNFTIKDFSGEVYVYGLLTAKDGESQKFNTLGVEKGDVVTLVGKRADYKGTAQVGNAYYESHHDVTAITVAEFLTKPNNKTDWYLLKGTVTNLAVPAADKPNYGNFDLVDETGTIYVYGVLTGVGGETKKFDTLGVSEGDVITIISPEKSEYNSKPQVKNGLYITHEGAAEQ